MATYNVGLKVLEVESYNVVRTNTTSSDMWSTEQIFTAKRAGSIRLLTSTFVLSTMNNGSGTTTPALSFSLLFLYLNISGTDTMIVCGKGSGATAASVKLLTIGDCILKASTSGTGTARPSSTWHHRLTVETFVLEGV